MNANALLVDWLIHSCLYYKLDTSVISDEEFDKLASLLRHNWDQVTHHHKDLVDVSELMRTSSGYYLKFPGIVVSCAEKIRDGKMPFRRYTDAPAPTQRIVKNRC